LLVPLCRGYFKSRAIGVVAAALALLHGPLVLHGLKLLPIPLALLTQAAGLCLLAWARRRPDFPVGALLAGASWGLAAVTRSEMLLFVPLALFALALPGPSRGSMSTGRRWLPPLLYLTGLALVLAPVTAHNLRRGDFVVVASAGGENLYVGNQAGAEGGHRALHHQAGDLFSQRALAQRLAEEAEGHELRPSQISAYWRRLALHDILESPGEWARLELHKLGRIAHPGDPNDIYPYALERARYLPLLYALPVTPWVLWILGLIGALQAIRADPARVWPLAGLALVHVAVLLAFFVSTRLRLPLLFMLTPFAAFAVVSGAKQWRDGRGRARIAAIGLLLLAITAVTHIGLRPTSRDARRLASLLSRQDRLEEALGVLEPMLAVAEPDAQVLDYAGWIHYKRGELELAAALYLNALQSGLPPHREPRTRTRLAGVLEEQGRKAEAAAQHDAAVSSEYAVAHTWFERGMFRLRGGDRDGAVDDLTRATRLDPAWPAPREALARISGQRF
jgi:4-amino-4-deoxy-L-arabinose transferase-like glycosyltransferase